MILFFIVALMIFYIIVHLYNALPAVVFYYWGQVAIALVECDVLVTSPLQGL